MQLNSEPAVESFKPRERTEDKIQANIVKYLRQREWFVKQTHGNAYQSGFPDLFATHIKWGARWIEVKVATAFSFTTAQTREYPMFTAHGTGVWIMTAPTHAEYNKLFAPCNLNEYLTCFHDGCRDILAWRGGHRVSERTAIQSYMKTIERPE